MRILCSHPKFLTQFFLVAKDRDTPMDTPMDIAVCGNDLGMVRLLLKPNSEANPAALYLGRLLCVAAERGYLEILNVLLEAAAAVAADTRITNHLLYSVAVKGHTAVVKYFLENCPNPPNIDSFALIAVEHGDLEMLKLFLDAGADPGYQTNLKWSLLHAAVKRVQVDMVAMLLAAGANPAVAEELYGFTPLHEAVYRCRYANSVVNLKSLL